jgi:branched-chain amino acid transport system ATP-binding protein
VPLLQTHDIAVQFGGVAALSEVSLTAEAAAVTGLIGPNGAGKTTLFNVITGLQSPNYGRVLLDDVDVTKSPVHRRAQLGLGRTFQRLELFGSMTVRENIQTAAEIRDPWSRDRVQARRISTEILEQVGLARYADSPAHLLPTGLARLTELARALATKPRLLLLDEPGSGLDTTESAEFGRILAQLAAQGIAILLVEHDMDLVMQACSHIHVLDFGVHIASGTPAEIQSDPAVQAAYLGEPPDHDAAALLAAQERVGS